MTSVHLTVHTDERTIWPQFTDDDGDVSGTPPAGSRFAFAADAVDADPEHPLVGRVEALGAGSHIVRASLDLDGQTIACEIAVEIDATGALIPTDPGGGPFIGKDTTAQESG